MDREIRSKLFNEMESYFGKDKRRIDHAHKVVEFAEEILKDSDNINELVIISAAVLHDIGIHACEKKYGSSAGHLQEKEGPPIAEGILIKLGFGKENIEEICQIIAHHHSPGKINTQNFRVLYDADWLVNLKDEVDTKDKVKLRQIIDKVFLTPAGKSLAEKIYLFS